MNSNGTKKQGNSLVPVRIAPLDYRPGDYVKKLHMIPSEIVGVVTHILPKTFKVRVQWPHGSEVESPEEIYKVSKSQYPATVSLDSSYDSHENRESEKAYGIGLPKKPKARGKLSHAIAMRYSETLDQVTFKAIQMKEASLSDVQAFMKLSSIYKGNVSDDIIKIVVASVYE